MSTAAIEHRAVTGMVVMDPAFPDDRWEVIQTSPVVYIRRQDGLYYHHTYRSWDTCMRTGTMVVVDAVASTATPPPTEDS